MKKFEISSITFALLYSLYSICAFGTLFLSKVYTALNPSSFSDYYFFFVLCIIALLAHFLLFNLLCCRFVTKFFAFLLLISSGFASYFMRTYNVLIDEDMIYNSLKTDINEVSDLLSLHLVIYIFFVVIVPIIVISFLKIKHSVKLFFKSIKITLILLPIALLLILSAYFKAAGFFRVNREFQHSIIPSNYIIPIFKITKNSFFPSVQDEELKIEDLTLENVPEDLNIIFVVGETARRKNFEIYGYERKTNPALSEVKDLKIIPNTNSCGTSTRISVPCIFSPSEKYQNYLPSLQKAGAFIKWYENNFGGCYGMCDEIPSFKVDHSQCDGSCPDGKIFDEFYKDFATQKRGLNLFILHQNGSHGPLYFKRYPKEFAKFKPECVTANVNECAKEELVNAYDNSILYTDFLLGQLIENVKKSAKPTVVIYVSDHGESLGEKGIFLHGFPLAFAPKEQIEIPFLVWSSFPIEIKEKKEYTHKNVMNLILSLMKAKSKVINPEDNIL